MRGRTGAIADSARLRAMFNAIAPVYDAMNTIMTAGLDARWRRAAVTAARLRPGGSALDVACGTGRLTELLAAAAGPDGRVVGIDVADRMLAVARRRAAARTRREPGRRPPGTLPEYVLADATALPFDDATFDAATIAFGLRNMPDYRAVLAEMRRVVRPDGHVVVLEIAVPADGRWGIVFGTWFRRIVPVLGRVAGRGSAYRYLPASLLAYPPPDAIAGHLRAVGLDDVRWRRLRTGMATLHIGRRGSAG